MRNFAPWTIVGCLLLGCGAPPAGNKGTEETGGGGEEETGGKATGGTKAQGMGGMQATGGSVGTGGSGSGGSGSGGSTGGSTGSGGKTGEPDAGAPPAGDAGSPVSGGPGPFGCTNCKPLFDGKTLDAWETRDATNWVVKDGVLASQGKVAPIWTKADLGNYRLFFDVRQVMGNHKPDVIFFGKRPGPGAGGSGALGGAQFQPPNGGSWNYGAGGTFSRPENPMWSEKKWHRCEVLVKEAGSFQAACCPMEPEAPCKIVLNWKGTGRKHPFAIQMHNPGLFDEYKNMFIEENPAEDGLLCIKK